MDSPVTSLALAATLIAAVAFGAFVAGPRVIPDAPVATVASANADLAAR